jgi:hypothetical protein
MGEKLPAYWRGLSFTKCLDGAFAEVQMQNPKDPRIPTGRIMAALGIGLRTAAMGYAPNVLGKRIPKRSPLIIE